MTSPPPSLAELVLAELAAVDTPVSAARLCKRLGVRMSVLLRTLAMLGADAAGEGQGWVDVEDDEGRLLLALSPRARAAFAAAV